MTAAVLRDIFLSEEYKHDVQELSCYLASITQERPMVFCLAKQIWKKGGYNFELEAKPKRRDLVVNGKHLEFKFIHDCFMEMLGEELDMYKNDPLAKMWGEVGTPQGLHAGWSVMPRIYKDVCVKKPDIFVWILCSRDFSRGIPDYVVDAEVQGNFREKHPYSDRSWLTVADRFLRRLQDELHERPFSILEAEIETNGDFRSTYHFRICDFACSRRPQTKMQGWYRLSSFRTPWLLPL